MTFQPHSVAFLYHFQNELLRGKLKSISAFTCNIKSASFAVGDAVSTPTELKSGMMQQAPAAIKVSAGAVVWTPMQIACAALAAKTPFTASSNTIHASGCLPKR